MLFAICPTVALRTRRSRIGERGRPTVETINPGEGRVFGVGAGTSAFENRKIGTVVALKALIEGFAAIAGTDLTIAELSDPACDV